MCLDVVTLDLGLAHAALWQARSVLAFAPNLAVIQRRTLARQLLTQAGQEQLDDEPDTVVCLCGCELEVSEAGQPPLALVSALRSGAVQLTLLVGNRNVSVALDSSQDCCAGQVWSGLQRAVGGE